MTSRRNFIKKTATGSVALTFGGLVLPSMANANILGANEHINCAIIGVRSRAKAHVMAIHQQKNAKIVYSCDVDDTILEEHNKWCQKNIGYIPKIEKDFRKVLEDKDVDAVFIATPEHWHAPMAIMALQAGKHVYVEKPCSHNPYENDLLVKAHKKYGKKVQMGNQQRSARTSIMGIEDIRNGVIGEVYKGEAYYSNNRGSIGKGKVIDVPDTLDWEMWQGPAPREKYRDNVHPYNWHWFKTWGTGEVHNNGTHEIDICRWALGVDLPESVTSFGGKYAYDDDWQFVDNQQVTYKYPDNKFITWTGHSRGKIMPKQPGRGATIYGSKGIIRLDRNFYKLYDLDGNLLKEEKEGAASATTNTMGQGQLDVNHVGNFFEAIRTDKSLHSDISDASISTMLCHLGNMAQDAGETLKIDQATGKILNNEKAMAHWKREYAEGWEPKL
ncbi:Tat (twin-arginine translocation) pathway signal sequence [Zobellia uliginosa]|uniref:Tat (Twin-arginine translocation) pathway signal sequence n=1 Tax=Zobellia uliginosa TaxID=143224 RepID=A0ABY1KLX3_9FLAO|nr:Gfo/Idh/MocA family oxidoreductase [Zobellia uliginosa]SIS48539.1 Tat (twin-arginine translocation) pathway signal sequence [Zobellia uliginosa]